MADILTSTTYKFKENHAKANMSEQAQKHLQEQKIYQHAKEPSLHFFENAKTAYPTLSNINFLK
jgi:hypothetical protein